MGVIRKITDEVAIAGRVTSEQLTQIVQEGFKSVLNLQSPEAIVFLSDEQQQARDLGLYHVNVPFEEISDEIASQVLTQIHELPKPILVHCRDGTLASVIVLMYIATRQGASLRQAFEQVEKLGLLK